MSSEQAAGPYRTSGQDFTGSHAARLQRMPSIRREVLFAGLLLGLAIDLCLLSARFEGKQYDYLRVLLLVEVPLVAPALGRALLRSPCWQSRVRLTLVDSGVALRGLFRDSRIEPGAVLGAVAAHEHLLLTLRPDQPSSLITPLSHPSLSKGIARALLRSPGHMGTIRFRVQTKQPFAPVKRSWLALGYIALWLLTLTNSVILWLLAFPMMLAIAVMLLLSVVMLIHEISGYAYLEVNDRGLGLRGGRWAPFQGVPSIVLSPGSMRIVIGASAEEPEQEFRLWESGSPAEQELGIIKAVVLTAAKAASQGKPKDVEASYG